MYWAYTKAFACIKRKYSRVNTFDCYVLYYRHSAGVSRWSMSGTGPGYMHTIIVTPYMHILIYHVPCMLRKHGSLKTFSRQGITNLLLVGGDNLHVFLVKLPGHSHNINFGFVINIANLHFCAFLWFIIPLLHHFTMHIHVRSQEHKVFWNVFWSYSVSENSNE